MNSLTTIAALPGSGSGCMSSLPPEKTDPPKVQMRSAYFEEALTFPEIDHGAIPSGGTVNVVVNCSVGEADARVVEQVCAAIAASRRRQRQTLQANKQGFEPFQYTERS